MDDTHPRIRAMQLQLYREMPIARKLELLEEEWRTLRELALAGIRQRHPEYSAAELAEELSKVLLGPELAAKLASRAARGHR